MENQIIDIEFEDGIISIAKIVKERETEYEVALLEYYGDGEWDFDTEDYTVIKKESVSGFYDTTKLEDTGLYEKLNNGMYAEIDESDFEYELDSSEDDESESDVSLDDEDF